MQENFHSRSTTIDFGFHGNQVHFVGSSTWRQRSSNTRARPVLPACAKGNGKSRVDTQSNYWKLSKKLTPYVQVILTPQSTLVDTYKALIVDENESDFQKILELKVTYFKQFRQFALPMKNRLTSFVQGFNRSEQKTLLEQYNESASAPSDSKGSSTSSSSGTPSSGGSGTPLGAATKFRSVLSGIGGGMRDMTDSITKGGNINIKSLLQDQEKKS